MATRGTQAQLHRCTAFLGHAQAGHPRPVHVPDAREAFVHYELHTVCTVALVYDFGHFASTTRTANL